MNSNTLELERFLKAEAELEMLRDARRPGAPKVSRKHSPTQPDESSCLAPPRLFRTILAPTDFSPLARRASRSAQQLAEHLGASLILLHVIEVPPHLPLVGPGLRLAKLEREQRENLEGLLKEECDAYTLSLDRKVAPPAGILAEGDATEEIVHAAEKSHADLIVMGSHGYRGLTRLILGSTAESVMRRASCPVLIIR